jgi:hypothetical protein
MWSLSIAALVAVAGEAFFVVVCAFIFSPFAFLLSGMNTPFRRFLFDSSRDRAVASIEQVHRRRAGFILQAGIDAELFNFLGEKAVKAKREAV